MSSSLGELCLDPGIPRGFGGLVLQGFTAVGGVLGVVFLCPGGFLEQRIPPGDVESCASPPPGMCWGKAVTPQVPGCKENPLVHILESCSGVPTGERKENKTIPKPQRARFLKQI